MNRTVVAGTFALAAMVALTSAAAQGEAYEHPIQLHEFEGGGMHIQPERISAQAGDQLKFIITNPEENSITHNVLVCGDPVDPNNLPEDEACGNPIAKSRNLSPGETQELTFTAPSGGVYEYYCDIVGHKTATPGMRGVLSVTGGEESNATPGLAALATLGIVGVVALALRRSG